MSPHEKVSVAVAALLSARRSLEPDVLASDRAAAAEAVDFALRVLDDRPDDRPTWRPPAPAAEGEGPGSLELFATEIVGELAAEVLAQTVDERWQPSDEGPL